MGYKLTKFSIVPCENEQIDAVIKVYKENRSVVYGVVLDECDEPIEDAVVKLLKKDEDGCLEPKYHTFTDEDGQFLFGPLNPGVEYVIKVWIKNEKSRMMIIHDEDCHHIHEDCDDTHRDGKYSHTYNNEHHNSCEDECDDSWNKEESCNSSYPKITHKITKQYGKSSKNYRKNYRSAKILHNEGNEFESIKDED